jgi:hypothetical protein
MGELMLRKFMIAGAAATGLIAASSVANAATITFDLRSGGTFAGSGYGNSLTYTSGDVTLRITAWGLTGNGNTTFQTAQLGQFSTGLGSCNRGEGTNCGDPAHQVDNVSQYDFVLFQLSGPGTFSFSSIVIDPFGTHDRDVSYYVGNAADPLSLTGTGLSGLAVVGLLGPEHDDASASSAARTVDLDDAAGNSLLFGARLFTDLDDRFKIKTLTINFTETITEVSEPGTLAAFGLGLAALGYVGRRRKAA